MNNNINYQRIILDLEQKIKNNFFESKDELNKYLINLKNNGFSQEMLTDEKILEYINLYDEFNKTEEASLNMENYKGVSLEEKKLNCFYTNRSNT